MTQQTEEETIKRRQRNADTGAGCLFEGFFEALGCAWILSCFALVSVMPFRMK